MRKSPMILARLLLLDCFASSSTRLTKLYYVDGHVATHVFPFAHQLTALQAGILLSELCRLSHRTASLLSHSRNTGSVELEGLGRLVLEHGEREDLQVVSCLIMKQLHAQSIQQDLFWPVQAPAITFAVPDSQELMSHLQDILDSVSEPRRCVVSSILSVCIYLIYLVLIRMSSTLMSLVLAKTGTLTIEMLESPRSSNIN